MRTETLRNVPRAGLVAFGAALVLAGLAAYNYATGVHGGAIVSGIGSTIAALFGVLVQ